MYKQIIHSSVLQPSLMVCLSLIKSYISAIHFYIPVFCLDPCYPNMRAIPLRLSHFFPQNFRPLGRHFSYCPLHTHDCCTNCTQECLVGITRKVHPGAGGANILQLQMSVTLTAPLLSPPHTQLTWECFFDIYLFAPFKIEVDHMKK